MILIHYGSKSFEDNKFREIKNRNFSKPSGGLWTSPIESNWGWKDWCYSEDFRSCEKENSFTIKLKDTAKVFKIDSVSDLLLAPSFDPFPGFKYINYEELSKEYDAIWLTELGQIETRFSKPMDLYGWDCESVLLLNKECFYRVEGLSLF